VDASKEGKNVLCPECRRPNRVPLRQKAQKADWRSGGGGPTLAKKETGLDREGAFGTAHMGQISDTTAREIVKGRESEEEPEERRKKWVKRGAVAGVAAVVLGVGGYLLFKGRQEVRQEARMEEAVKELKEGTNDPRFQAFIYRASGEHKIRSSGGKKDTDAALQDLKLARNTVGNQGAKTPEADRNAILAQVAITMGDLLGTTAQVDKEERLKKDDVVKELRQTIERITDPDLAADVVRALTRKFAEKGQAAAVEEVARNLQNLNPPELIGQVGLELLRLQPDAHRQQAEDVLKRTAGDVPALQALRLALGHPPVGGKPVGGKKGPEKGPEKKGADTVSYVATAEAEALKGNVAAAAAAAKSPGQPEERLRAYVAASQAVIDSKPAEAAGLLDSAVTQAKAGTPAPWVVVRLCRLLAKAGKFDLAESIMPTLPDDASRGWARLEILRGRLAAAGTGKADDSWLTPLGEPTKSPAAAKAHEDLARHNAAAGIGDYQTTVKNWPLGSVRPFGMAGLVLGRQDRDLR
jgi:predicted negative regulator of RcsB-dependent stress response